MESGRDALHADGRHGRTAPGHRRQARARERPGYALDEIIATNGAKSAIYSAFAITLEPGDEVIIPAPYWVSYPDMVLACDGMPVTVACPEANGFKITPAQLEAAITPRTRWLLLNSPSNPDRGQLHRRRVPRAGRRAGAPSRRCW